MRSAECSNILVVETHWKLIYGLLPGIWVGPEVLVCYEKMASLYKIIQTLDHRIRQGMTRFLKPLAHFLFYA